MYWRFFVRVPNEQDDVELFILHDKVSSIFLIRIYEFKRLIILFIDESVLQNFNNLDPLLKIAFFRIDDLFKLLREISKVKFWDSTFNFLHNEFK